MTKRNLIYLTGFGDVFPKSIRCHIAGEGDELKVGTGHVGAVVQQIRPLVQKGCTVVLDITPAGRKKHLSPEARYRLTSEGLIE